MKKEIIQFLDKEQGCIIKKNYLLKVIQYTSNNDKEVIEFGEGNISFKEVFNAENKNREYRLIGTCKSGREVLIPLYSFIVDNLGEYEIYNETEFYKKYKLVSKLCDDTITDFMICECCEYYQKNKCDFGQEVKKELEHRRIMIKRNLKYGRKIELHNSKAASWKDNKI